MDDPTTNSRDEADDQTADGVERIADPDNYNLRRRLKQLHDAKERVRERKSKAVYKELTDRKFKAWKRDQLVAEAVVDYINDLRSLLAGKDEADVESFLNESISIDDSTRITIADFVRTRGYPPRQDDIVHYSVSMEVWRICNDHFEEVAGAEFEQQGLPNYEFDNRPEAATGDD